MRERTTPQMLPDDPAERKRHAIGVREPKVGNGILDFGRQPRRFGEALTVQPSQPKEALLASSDDGRGRTVGAKELLFVEFVARRQARQRACEHESVAHGSRAVVYALDVSAP